jgi:predicted small lipoprotein YifL
MPRAPLPLAALLLALSACGYKGPLYLPKPEAQKPVAQKPAPAAPPAAAQ